ncbi:hypothetical protein WN943_021256 [Citrus x changshan-huyou]
MAITDELAHTDIPSKRKNSDILSFALEFAALQQLQRRLKSSKI